MTSTQINPILYDSRITGFNTRRRSILGWYMRDLVKAAWTYIQYSNANIKAVVGFELEYGKNKEARVLMWQPRYLKEGEESLETLDVEAVIDREVHEIATNTTKALHLSLDVFADAEVETMKSERLPRIMITYLELAEFLEKAERLQPTKRPPFGEASTRKKSSRRTKKRKRPSNLMEKLSSDRDGISQCRKKGGRAHGRRG
ncbi:hypothetical protein LSUB1_G001257 [Lachnellula subtilissima]|uniref:Uncharacterized protein n=1 Tax=Lachnellula subtilissima TaxID=602034 RepID=A0A8H8UH64_9HELO|nr:hypothetical protein LSUB1_G001257 [Lachnellula subtilissima]